MITRGRTILVDLQYPRSEDNPNEVEIDLTDVRAADPIRVTYDFDRDGWSILQGSKFEWDSHDKVCDADWQEVAFVQAWGREAKSGQSGSEKPS